MTATSDVFSETCPNKEKSYIVRVFWTANKTCQWVLNTAGTIRELLDFVKATKLAYFGHIMRKQGNCEEKEIMQRTMSGRHRRGKTTSACGPNLPWRDQSE